MTAEPRSVDDEAARSQTRRKRIWLALKLLGTGLGLCYVAFVADLGRLVEVATALPLSVPVLVMAIMIGGTAVGAVRWKVVLWAYGAERSPPLTRLTYLYLIAFFYNTFLPGGIGGDVIRGIVSRESFGEAGITRSLTVVFVERVLGLAGLLIVASTALVIHPLPGLPGALHWGAVGLVGAAATVLGIAMGRRLADWAPPAIGRWLAKLPPLSRPSGLVGGVVLSLGTQLITALVGYLVLVAVTPTVGVLDALVIAPVAAAASFFPLTVGGAGVREAAFVFLCSSALGMEAADAAASSLLLFACQLAVAGLAGLLQLAVPLDPQEMSG